MLSKLVSHCAFLRKIKINLDNQYERDAFVIDQLGKISTHSIILDAGCGSQRYKNYCRHLEYRSQDFGQYVTDVKQSFTDAVGGDNGYQYGRLDYSGNIWDINEKSGTFDAILCTEVLEHIPFPNETINEFSRLLKNGGKLILTAPCNSMRHMDPYYFYSGFSDRWFEKLLSDNGFSIELIEPIGDYYSWLSVEMARTAISHSLLAKICLMPAFLYFYNKKKTDVSTSSLCMGYHVVAKKL